MNQESNSNQEPNSNAPQGTFLVIPCILALILPFFVLNFWITADYSTARLFNPSDNWFGNLLNVPVALAWCALNLVSVLAGLAAAALYFYEPDEGTGTPFAIGSGAGSIVCLLSFHHMMYSPSLLGAIIVGSILFCMIPLLIGSLDGSSSSSSGGSWIDDNNPFGGAGGFTNRDESEMRWMRDSKVSGVRKEYHDIFNKRGRIRDK
jgi:hypothetical protein